MNAEGIFGPLLGDAEVAAILGDRASARAMVEVEVALAKVEGRLGVIDPAAAATIEAALAEFAPDEADLARGTAAAGVPVPALVAQLRRQVGGEAAGFRALGCHIAGHRRHGLGPAAPGRIGVAGATA